ncbi:type IV secretory system conjugative DNA transfer family protein [Psychrobacter sp. AOP5-CZ1-12]|uniref:type IV secretory system conjugative DNA transfer family protein n=1 Tax=Psychrobacter sp. AOP5-CZ1-12 TaxID=3457651 RepID=UPI00402B1425
MPVMVIVAVFLLAFAAIYIWFSFFNETKKSGFIYERSIDDKEELFRVLNNNDDGGEPLIAYANVSNKKLKDDPWRNDLPIFTVPCEERGLVLGVSRSGKTNYLLAQLISWMRSGKSFVASDVKPELWGILKWNGVFEYYGYDDVVFNPTDPLSQKYNMFDDLGADADTEIIELIEILIPAHDAFSDSARRILRAVMLHLRTVNGSVSLLQARNYIDEYIDVEDMMDELLESPSDIAVTNAKAVKRSSGGDRFIASATNALSSALQFLDNKTIAKNIDSSDFSLRERLQQPRQAIFLQFDKQYQQTTRELFGATLSHTLRLLEVDYANRDDVFVALDELINAAPIPNLTKKLNVIGSSKMPLFMYVQALDGLTDVYGDQAANLIMSSCTLKVCYRVNDFDTAQRFSNMIGNITVRDWGTTETPRVSEAGRSYNDTNRTERVIRQALIEPAALQKLEKNQAIVLYQGHSAKMLMPTYYEDTPAYERAKYVSPSALAAYLENADAVEY